jgi:hypothetical protein
MNSVGHPCAQPNAGAKTNQRGSKRIARTRAERKCLHRIVLRHKDYLRIRRLHHNHLGPTLVFDPHRLVLIRIQHARGKRPLPQPLHRIHHRSLVRLKRGPQRRKVVDMRRHHSQHLGKVHKRNKGGIETSSLRSIRQRLPLKVPIQLQPAMHVENLLRVLRRGSDLGEQGIRRKRDGSH